MACGVIEPFTGLVPTSFLNLRIPFSPYIFFNLPYSIRVSLRRSSFRRFRPPHRLQTSHAKTLNLVLVSQHHTLSVDGQRFDNCKTLTSRRRVKNIVEPLSGVKQPRARGNITYPLRFFFYGL